MSRVPHLPQIIQGPLSARPSAAQTPDWVWYFAWDDDGGAFYRPTREGWVKATPSVDPSRWINAALANGWSPISPLQFRKNGDRVELRGVVRRTGGVFPSEITTFPAGYRPLNEVRLPVVIGQNLGYVSIASNGVMTVYNPLTPGSSTDRRVYLDAVRFAAIK